MALRQLLFVMGWSPAVGVREVGFHPELRRNGREVMGFAETVEGTVA